MHGIQDHKCKGHIQLVQRMERKHGRKGADSKEMRWRNWQKGNKRRWRNLDYEDAPQVTQQLKMLGLKRINEECRQHGRLTLGLVVTVQWFRWKHVIKAIFATRINWKHYMDKPYRWMHKATINKNWSIKDNKKNKAIYLPQIFINPETDKYRNIFQPQNGWKSAQLKDIWSFVFLCLHFSWRKSFCLRV